MKKRTTDIITSMLGVLLFLFAMAAVWAGKITVLQSLMVLPFSLVCVAFRNEALKKVLYSLLRIKEDE